MIGRLSSIEIEQILTENNLGRIGYIDNDQVLIVPINYLYNGNSIVAHSVKGLKIDAMRKNRKLCFEVEEVKSFTNWKTVVASGEYHEITDGLERYETMQLFVDHMMNLKVSETAMLPETYEKRMHPSEPHDIDQILYRIFLTERNGRFEM